MNFEINARDTGLKKLENPGKQVSQDIKTFKVSQIYLIIPPVACNEIPYQSNLIHQSHQPFIQSISISPLSSLSHHSSQPLKGAYSQSMISSNIMTQPPLHIITSHSSTIECKYELC